jgi:hypothetical protein
MINLFILFIQDFFLIFILFCSIFSIFFIGDQIYLNYLHFYVYVYFLILFLLQLFWYLIGFIFYYRK